MSELMEFSVPHRMKIILFKMNTILGVKWLN